MAVAFFSPSQIILHKSCLVIKPGTKIFMLKHNQISLKKSNRLQVKSFDNKVFENQSEGIICYRDENGELICEGFDEGPRFHQNLARTSSYDSRDAEIVNLLHQRLLQVINGTDSDATVVQEDLKWNGFNKFC